MRKLFRVLLFCAFCGLDRCDLFRERGAKLRQDVDQQVDLCEAQAPFPFRAKKELKLDHTITVGNDHPIVAPLVRTFMACLDVRMNVRGEMS